MNFARSVKRDVFFEEFNGRYFEGYHESDIGEKGRLFNLKITAKLKSKYNGAVINKVEYCDSDEVKLNAMDESELSRYIRDMLSVLKATLFEGDCR